MAERRKVKAAPRAKGNGEREHILYIAESFTRIFDIISDPVIVHDRNFRMLAANRAAQEFFGRDWRGVPCFRYRRRRRTICPQCPARQACQTRSAVQREFHDPRTGESFLVISYPVVNPQGEVEGVIEINHRITEIKQREQEIKKLNEELARRNRQLENQQLLLDREMTLARTVQRNLLPKKMPETPGYQLAARYLPTGSLGGDFYDVVELSNNRLGLAIADVSGHGVPAALVTAMTKVSFRQHARRFQRPGGVLVRMNNDLADNLPEDYFVTMLYLVVERETGNYRISSAGHVPPFLVKGRTHRVFTVPVEGFFLGRFPKLRLNELRGNLKPGEGFFLYTDGLVEVQRGKRMMDRKLLRTLVRTNFHLHPDKLIDRVVAGIRRASRGAKLLDDAAVLVLKRT